MTKTLRMIVRALALCSLLLVSTNPTFAEDQPEGQPSAPPQEQSSQVAAPQSSEPAPSAPDVPKETAPPLPAAPTPEPPPSAEATPAPAATSPVKDQTPPTPTPQASGQAAPVPSVAPSSPAQSEAHAKKSGAKSTVGSKAAAIKAFGARNNVPPFLAAFVEKPTQALQKHISWARHFAKQPAHRQVTAAPPLLAGIRPAVNHFVESAEEPEAPTTFESIIAKKLTKQENQGDKSGESLDMLASLVELQKNIKQQIIVTNRKLKGSTSDTEKQSLQEELKKLDKQLSETGDDFERIATGVEPEVFAEKKRVAFSWKDEVATLLEPSIKELKQLTARARHKTQLKETISEYGKQVAAAHHAVENLNKLHEETKNPKLKAYLGELLPAWQNVEKRIRNKLDVTQLELNKLENNDSSLIKSSGTSVREFFRTRGLYLLIALVAFGVILLAFKLISRLVFYILPGAQKEQRPFHVRVLDIFFQIFSVTAASCGLIFVLYTAEDWVLLSMTIILILGLAWTVRQALPKMWQQARLVLNMGSIREGERLMYNGIPWKVESLNVFCKLYNPALGMHLRIPIENMIGMISRPYHVDEPWFPCKKGDWISIDGKLFAKVASVSLEQVELVEIGGRRTVYQTPAFLGLAPANLSRNFSIRVPFGLSYDLQEHITTTVPQKLKTFLQKKLDENGYGDDCLSLSVDFLQAGASSLDLVVLADFKGEQAAACKRLERAFAKWCVECCNANNWEIPFPQMTVHQAAIAGN